MRTSGALVVGLLAVSIVACGGADNRVAAPSQTSAPVAVSPPPPTHAETLAALTGSPTSEAEPSPARPAVTAAPIEAKEAAPKTISARHVLIQWMGCDHAGPSVVRTRDQAFEVASEVLRRARAGADFARLAVEFSDEPNAGQRGGGLGRFGRGQMVKAFEEAAFALKPGEISGIVESPFGYHIIQRTE